MGDNMNYAVILAAGKGSRMNQSIPKCCVEILHKPMISYIVDSIDNLDLDETICIVGDKRNYIMDLLKDRVSYRVQSRPLGSADAIKVLKGIDEEGYGLKCNKYKIEFPPQHQDTQPGMEYLMYPRPIFANPNFLKP